MTETIFISYSSHDAAAAQAVCAALEAASFSCWIAPRNIQPGQQYGAAIIEGINRARLMVLVLSTHSHDSPQVLREVERAVAKNVLLLPIRIDGVALSGSMEYFLSTQHWLDAQTGALETHMPALVTTVASLVQRTAPAVPGPEPRIDTPQAAQPSLPPPVTMVTPPESSPKETPRRSMGLPITVLVLVGGGLWLSTHSPPRPTTVEKTASPTTVESAPRATPAPGSGPSPSVAATRLTTEEYEARLAALRRQTAEDISVADHETWERGLQRSSKRAEEIRYLLDHAPAASTRSPILDMKLQGRPAREHSYKVEPVSESDFQALRAKAEAGDAGAQYDLARQYWHRWGENQKYDPYNASEAKKWLDKAMEQGHIKAQTLAVNFHGKGILGYSKNEQEVLRLLRKASSEGDGEASYSLGLSYTFRVYGLEKDVKEAFRMYRLALDQGYLGAAEQLGFAYLDGEGTERNEKAAFEVFSLGVDELSDRLALGLARCYENGWGTAKDLSLAIKYYEKCEELSDEGNPDARARLEVLRKK